MEYFSKTIALTEAQTPADLRKDEGTPSLQVQAYYMRDARRRGLKLSVNRVVKRGGATIGMPLSQYNGLIHVQDLSRQNNKAGQALAARLESNWDKIEEIALASETPDWQALIALVHPETV